MSADPPPACIHAWKPLIMSGSVLPPRHDDLVRTLRLHSTRAPTREGENVTGRAALADSAVDVSNGTQAGAAERSPVTLPAMPSTRRSSRRTSRPSSSPGGRRVTIRHGSISGPGFKATAYKGSDPAFRGRIAVERGSGMIEFPSLAQLPRILREEGIPATAAEQAFGRKRGLKANGAVVREGYLKIGDTEASEYAGGEKRLAGKIHISAPGVDAYKSPSEFQRLAQALGIDAADVFKAFGHMLRGAKLSEGGPGEEGPHTFGPRRMKLGHLGPKGFAPGTRRGSLVLVDTRGQKIVWGVVEETPGNIRNMATNRVVSLDSVFAKAKALKIPPQAVYDAFGHLMNAADKKALIATFHGMGLAKNKRARRR